MRYKRYILILIILVVKNINSLAQSEKKVESSVPAVLLYGSYSYELPGRDLATRFGNNSALGGGVMYKTSANWLWSIEANYLFGRQIREKGIFNQLTTEDGYIIGSDGLFADVRVSERGFRLPVVKIGKIFNLNILSTNPNSGFFVMAGAGFLQHKIHIQDISRTVDALEGDYRKGYDRLTNGLALSENIGYMYLDKKRLINFFVSVEFTQAFTKNRRSFNFDTMEADNSSRLDLLTGFKFGWIIPIYKHDSNKEQIYYY